MVVIGKYKNEPIKKIITVFENVEIKTIPNEYILNFEIVEKCVSMAVSNKATKSSLSRLNQYNDITCFEVYYADESVVKIYPDWHDKDEESNRYQRNFTNNHGDLFIGIGRNKSIEDFYSFEYLENPYCRL